MLTLKNITKDYVVAGKKQQVLKGLNISFRKSEFVSILGPSGCGKTTTLNIIGGLDKYTSGDLVIAGKSTKDFSDRDWDIYRNQRIGFVFQTYNLIPHQNILSNVELALAITGIKKEERRRRAKEALDRVGLEGLYHKKPNQLSGGQCQRVAIARALINEPEILLADEPTGALDSVTSKQIMDLIKKISKDKLVIMVTHNPDIAEEYSNRIIRLVDGEVISDSHPFDEEKEKKEVEKLDQTKKEKKSKSKMSLWTAFKLSARNLFSKRTRTILTCIAGSIGIIGISAVLALSNGVQAYIAGMENDMLSGTPISIKESAFDMDIISNLSFGEKKDILQAQDGYINVDQLMQDIADRLKGSTSMMITNRITDEYRDYVLSISPDVAAVNVEYGIDVTNNIYTDFTSAEETYEYSISAIKNIYTSILKHTAYSEYATLITSVDDVLMQAPANDDYILSQYDILTGKLAKEKDEIMLVVDENSATTDLFLAQLGYISQEEFVNSIYKVTDDPKYDANLSHTQLSYEDLIGKQFVWHNNDTVFASTGNSQLPFTYKHDAKDFEGGLPLKIVGILRPKESIRYGCLESGMYYTEALTQYVLEQNKQSAIVKFLDDNKIQALPSMDENKKMFSPVTYQYSYKFEGNTVNETGIIGQVNSLASAAGMFFGDTSSGENYILTRRNLGGDDTASEISIFPVDSKSKEIVIAHLDAWNSDDDITIGDITLTAEDREKITYTDNLSIIISMIDSMVNIVTIALICFTSLSLFVSCVMIAIMTYVSVMERVKEIGVIRSLGGRKFDVANLFNAENLMIGFSSGLIGVLVTYLIVLVANIVVNSLTGFGTIAIFPIHYALIMIALSVSLSMLSGIIPAFKASKQDPVVALRTE